MVTYMRNVKNVTQVGYVQNVILKFDLNVHIWPECLILTQWCSWWHIHQCGNVPSDYFYIYFKK